MPINVDKTDAVDAIMDWSDGRGADVVFEAVGGSANTLEQATEIAAKRGRICMVGGHRTPLSFSERFARSRELTVIWVVLLRQTGWGKQNSKLPSTYLLLANSTRIH